MQVRVARTITFTHATNAQQRDEFVGATQVPGVSAKPGGWYALGNGASVLLQSNAVLAFDGQSGWSQYPARLVVSNSLVKTWLAARTCGSSLRRSAGATRNVWMEWGSREGTDVDVVKSAAVMRAACS